MSNNKNNKKNNLKIENWNLWKARSLRASFLTRLKRKFPDNYDERKKEVPTIKEIQVWLKSKEPFICYLTNESIDKSKFEVDHLIPVSRGGLFDITNLDITSSRYNKIKGDMTHIEFSQLIGLTFSWEDNGKHLLNRLHRGVAMFIRRR